MMIIDEYYAEMLMLANGLLLSIACYAIVRFERRCREIDAFWSSPTGTAIAGSDDEQADIQLKVTQRLEQHVGELQRTVKVMELKRNEADETQTASAPIQLPIDNAIRMAKQGASVADLTRSCGLNLGEAELMKKLHGRNRRAAAAS